MFSSFQRNYSTHVSWENNSPHIYWRLVWRTNSYIIYTATKLNLCSIECIHKQQITPEPFWNKNNNFVYQKSVSKFRFVLFTQQYTYKHTYISDQTSHASHTRYTHWHTGVCLHIACRKATKKNMKYEVNTITK